ncbi:hypothetical protein I6A84_12915 [Frankia sp. CNm7]|uniref:Uncharacterized protein n=1 Tax=Frankia nepalensis TaxID=1836974 RepID=A0A937RIP1_9ACTN|nr:hypothetical protein [Frankia nepalensis]MBL7497517.1 hypothetical protein [Frankia nepalensis]MBL7510216.1 hypothetical protein [Frankia nepalensis]MBL7518985.1 hypothetical protein [Frankia nepalensis]MBL7630927.1 hypothetical protein [Frankia nepalensis]
MASSRGDDEPTARVGPPGRGARTALVAVVREAHPDGGAPVRYIQCDACDGPTPHHTEVQIFSATTRDPVFVGAPPEVVCGVCRSVHPRVVGDEPPRDTEVTCAVRRRPRWLPSRRLSNLLAGVCPGRFLVPSAAGVVVCPRCGIPQPGPAATPRRGRG